MTWDTGERAKPDPKPKPAGSSWGDRDHVKSARKRRGLVAIVLGSLAGVVVLLALVAPMVAGAMAPGMVADAASASIAGRVEVDRIHLGWFSAQSAENVRLFDPDGDRVASIDAKLDKGLLGVIFGGLDIGTVELSGRADIVRGEDGQTNLERAIAATSTAPADGGPTGPPGPAEPLAVPSSLRAVLDITGLNLTYEDAALREASGGAIGVVKVADLVGNARIAPGEKLSLRLKAALRSAPDANADGTDAAGAIAIRVSADGVVDNDGVITAASGDPKAFNGIDIDADIELSEVSTALLDAFAGQQGRLVASLGPSLSLTLGAKGPSDSVETTLVVESEAFDIEGTLIIDGVDGRVRGSSPFVVNAQTARLAALAPDIIETLERDQRVQVVDWPSLVLTLRDLDVSLPLDGTPDLRGSGAVVSLQVGPASARVPSPADPDVPWSVVTEPLTVELNARDLASSVSLLVQTAASVDGRDAGRLGATFDVADLLDGAGAIRTDAMPTVSGSVSATNVALGLLEPMLASTGLRLTSDIGQTITLTANAAPSPVGGQRIGFEARATNFVAKAGVDVSPGGERVSLAEGGASVELKSAAPMLTRVAGDAGVEVVSTQPFVVKLSRFDANIASLTAGDLRNVSVQGELTVGDTTAWVRTPSTGPGERRHVTLSGVNAKLNAKTLADGLRVTMGGSAKVDNRSAGGLSGDVFASGFLDEQGAVSGGIPSRINGEIALTQVGTDVLQPLVADAGLVLAEDLGQSVDVRIRANAGAVVADGTTDVVLTVEADRASARAEIIANEEIIRLARSGLVVEHTGTGRTAARVAGLLAGGDVRVVDAGSLRLEVPKFRLPIDRATRAPKLDELDAEYDLTLDNVAIQRPATESTPLAGLRLHRLVINGNAAPGKGLKADLDAGLQSAGRPFSIAGDFTLPSLESDPISSARGSISLNDAPVFAADVFAPPVAGPDGQTTTVGGLLESFLGAAFSVTLSTEPEAGDTRTARAEIRGDRVQLVSNGRVAVPPEGDLRVTSFTTDGSVEVTPTAFTRALMLAGIDPRGPLDDTPAEPQRGAARGPASNAGPSAPLRLDEPIAVRVRGGLDGQDRLDITVSADRVALSGLEAFAKTPRPVGPVLAALQLEASAPASFSSNAAGPSGAIEANFKGSVQSRAGDPLVSITANATVPLVGAAPRGRSVAKVTIDRLDAAFADRVLDTGGLIAQGLGGNVSVRMDAEAQLRNGAVTSADATVTPTARRLRARTPLRLALRDDTLSLAEPFDLEWSMTPEFATQLLTPEPAEDAGERGDTPTPPLRVVSETSWRLKGDVLRLPLADAAAEPPVVGVSVAGGAVRVRLPSGQDLLYSSTSLSARTNPDNPNVVNLDAEITGGPTERAAYFTGRLFDPGSDDPAITGNGELTGLTTALVDALAGANGAISTLLGETVSGRLNVRDFPRNQGTVTLKGSSPNASLSYSGVVTEPSGRPKRLTATTPPELRLERVDAASGAMLRSFVPAYGSVRKERGKHQPAVINFSRLIVPFDGEIKSIDALATVDPGEFMFDVDGALGSLLKLAGGNTEGNALERFDRVVVAMKNGVATYDQFRLPIGEFAFESSGIFDLNENTEQVTLWAPFASLAAEGLNLPTANATQVINPDALIPLRREGDIGAKNPWKIDLGGTRGNLFSPRGVGNTLRDIFGGG
ncbi:MAG: hypothetical protein AAGI53_03975 [Planctomycetota bacterium]